MRFHLIILEYTSGSESLNATCHGSRLHLWNPGVINHFENDLFAVCVLAMGELVSHKPLADKGSADKKKKNNTY